MNGKMNTTWKIAIDFTATVFLLAAMGFRITGTSLHEIVGVIVFALIIVHNVLNRKWYETLLSGRYGLFRTINTTFNALLIVSMLVLLITGMMISRLLFSFVPNPDGMLVRQLHVLSAYWSLIFVSIHLGLHWKRVLAFTRKMLGNPLPSRIRTYSLRLVAFLVFIFGVKVFFDREIWAKLTMYYSFGFWDSGEPAILFFAAYLSLMAACVVLGHYGMKLLHLFSTAQRTE